MSVVLVDRVKVQVLSSGTGPFVLGTAAPAYRGSEALIDGQTYRYAAESGSLFEVGTGTYLSSSNSLVRSPAFSSAGNAAVNFSAGIDVIFTALAVDYGGTDITAILELENALAAPTGAALIGKATGGTVEDSLTRFFEFTNPDFVLESLGATVPANGVYMGAGGNSLSYQTLVSVPSGVPDIDNQRGTMLLVATTSDDGNSEEQTLCLLTTIGTGFRPAWTPSTVYALGANVDANGQIYRCTTAGTSAPSGSGPSGVGTAITDGTVVWRWINAQAIGAKLGVYNETLVVPGAGSVWAMVNNLQIETGYIGGFAATIENDLQNNSGVDSTPNSYYKFNTWLSVNGPSKSTAVIEMTSSNLSNPATIWALHFSGNKLAEKAVIGIEASAEVCIGIGQASGGLVNPTFSVAVYRDTSTSPKGISLAGVYSSAAIEVTGNTPVALNIGGTKTLAGILEGSTSPKGLSLSGTYSSAALEVTGGAPVALNLGGVTPIGINLIGTYATWQVFGTGWNVGPTGGVTARSVVTTPGTVAQLPTGVKGMRSFVTDATAATFGSAVTGGGANNVPVWHNGTAWKVG